MHAEDLELARRAFAREPEALRRFAERAACVPASSYRGESRLETWVCGFAFHELRKHWERCARRGGHVLDGADEPGPPPSLPTKRAS